MPATNIPAEGQFLQPVLHIPDVRVLQHMISGVHPLSQFGYSAQTTTATRKSPLLDGRTLAPAITHQKDVRMVSASNNMTANTIVSQ
jgi:hypothetical protein